MESHKLITMTSSAPLMDRIVIRICCALTISATLVSGIFLPGYNDQRQLHVCADGMRDLSCTLGEFLWVNSVVIGYSRNYSSGCTTAPSDCMRNLTDHDYWRATSYQVYGGVTVPVETVKCEDSTLQLANYVLITYSCTSELRLNSMDICSRESRTLVEGHLTNPRWALGVAAQPIDCTCRLEATSGISISARLFLMYTDLPEQISCGERTSIEDQVGNVLLHHCSPGWRQPLVSPNSVADTIPGTTSLQVRFIKDHTNDYPPRMTKLWYGFEATAPLQVTCGPTGSNTTPMSATSPPSNLSETIIIIIVCAVCGTLVLVVIAGVVACVLTHRNRPLSTQVTTPTLTPPPAPSASMGPGRVNSAYVEDPYYSEIDPKVMGVAAVKEDGEPPPYEEVDGYLTHNHGYRPPIAPPNEYVHDIYLSHVGLNKAGN